MIRTLFISMALLISIIQQAQVTGDPGVITNYFWNGSSYQLNSSATYSYYYDDDGNCLIHEVSQYIWSSDLGEWVLFAVMTYSYDLQWHLTEVVVDELWGEWYTSWIYAYSYENDLLTESLSQANDQGNNEGAMVNMSRELYSYNSDNKVDSLVVELWENESWVPMNLTTFTYDEDGLVTEQIVHVSLQDGEWTTLSSKHVFEYNEEGKKLSDRGYEWVQQNSSWLMIYEELYTYDADGTLEFYTSEILGAWPDKWRLAYTYESGLTVTETVDVWNYVSEEWYSSGQNTFADHCITAIHISEVIAEPIQLFPNPGSSPRISFMNGKSEMVNVEIFNTTGQVLHRVNLYAAGGPVQVPGTDQLANGTYIVRIVSADEVYSLPWVKE